MIVRRDNFTNRKAVRFFNVTIWFESRSKPYHLPSKFYQTETKTDMITLSSKESVQWPYTERHSGSFIAVLCKTTTRNDQILRRPRKTANFPYFHLELNAVVAYLA